MNIEEFGTCGNGSRDDSKAIQAALDENDGTVVIPEGVYKIGTTLRIRSSTRLLVHPSARLFLADGAGVNSQSFLLTNHNHDGGDHDIYVEGGIWDGNNLNNPRGPDEPGSYTGALLNFINVAGLSIQQLTVRDAESYFIRLGETKNFVVADIRFEAPNLRDNQDGVHLGGYCEDGVIRDLVGIGESTNDDLVALNADDALQRAQNLDLKCGPIRNIRVENLKADSCHSFVRLLSVHSPITNINIENIEGGCRCMALNLDGCRECRVKLFDPSDPKYQDGVGDISRVQIKNLRVHKSASNDASPLINLRTNVHDFVVVDFHRDRQKDVNPAAPTILFSDCRASRMILDGVTRQQMETIQLSSAIQSEVVERDAFPMDQAELCGRYQVDQKGVFRLQQNGFTALSVNSTK